MPSISMGKNDIANSLNLIPLHIMLLMMIIKHFHITKQAPAGAVSIMCELTTFDPWLIYNLQ